MFVIINKIVKLMDYVIMLENSHNNLYDNEIKT